VSMLDKLHRRRLLACLKKEKEKYFTRFCQPIWPTTCANPV